MSEARHYLERYLRRIGLHAPTDAAQQFQVTLLRQWVDHLDEVLDINGVQPELRITIIREFLYGAMPMQAEAGVREELSAEALRWAQQAAIPRTGAT